MIAALFVMPGGPYANRPDVDLWPESRDARLYAGPWPVVAHPPCQLWTNLARVNFKRWGGEHNRPGNDGGCFSSALSSVDRWGGVLEHPAESHAWPAHGLSSPVDGCWTLTIGGGWVAEVWQSAYGHRARKRTWLYYRGRREPLPMDWRRLPGTHQIGKFDRNKPTLYGRAAIATPLPFLEALLALARNAIAEVAA